MNYSSNSFFIEPLKFEDALNLNKLLVSNTERFKLYLPKTLSENRTLESTKSYIAKREAAMLSKQEYTFTIKDNITKSIAGLIILKAIDWNEKKAEFAYCMGKKFEAKGWMSEAIQAASKFAFKELKLKKLQIISHKSNLASIKIAERNNYVWVKTLKKEFTPVGSESLDMELYELTYEG
ncbi:MAG: GNAT family N-acetyltransferase [Flavobacteriales bacterium]|nr:GNAT family N-acetyltransferase [Flavobacteriia bacterium]NCP06666.1 GNAT family N-acetyltransferase [Flavobacteriales bacterium]PIV92985.1 MAG: N-acetyltransferase [Flavobacteriaceae bacterium CG17_big_fil_post_rev_8_21_14_2_50_33_15]PIY13455.1 MAG: N-acetyltransferase [Flavobacteriaceae bacterium CG_4_10_14_3_um_filter_33_47]PJB18476.1 MAG: N-acetyltransferase [Flavobacteriaceae bacterium CG_4_9_14_3_um_filter_33_16]